MKRNYAKRRKNPQIKREGSRGFPEGWNTLAHPSALKNTELSEVINAGYSQYGTLSKRLGTHLIGEPSVGGTKIESLGKAYNINGHDYFIRISDSGKPEYYDYGAGNWTYLSATAPVGYTGLSPTFTDGIPTFSAGVRTNIVQVMDKLFFANGTDNLIYLSGTQWYAYNPLADPGVAPTVAKTGTGTGTVTRYYKYVWYNETGGTMASPVVSIASQPAKLDATTYNTVTFTAGPAGTTSIGIFMGYVSGQETFLARVEPGSTTFVDNGTATPSQVFGLPTSNTTRGYKFKLLDSYHDTLIGITNEMGDDTLVYSAGGDKLTSFGLPDGAGYYSWRRGDGENINAIKTFVASNEDSLFIFKDSKTGKFRFEVDGASVADVNIGIGSQAPLSPHIAGNNLRFYTREGVGALGNEANFGTIIRYSVMSIKAEAVTKQITMENMPLICSEYINHLSIFSIPMGAVADKNNACLVYDERYNSWALWQGIYASSFMKFITPDNEEKLYYGSNITADVLEMFSGNTDYWSSTGSGTNITMSITTKDYDMNLPDQYKKFSHCNILFGLLSGNRTSVQVIEDGKDFQPRLLVESPQPEIGFGLDEWSEAMIGDASGSLVTFSTINPRTVKLRNRDLLSVKVNIMNEGVNEEVEFMGVFFYYAQSNKRLKSSMELKKLY